jgi:uncharacterized protein (UPF0276 family)
MVSVDTRNLTSRPALATTYEGVGAGFLNKIAPLVDYLEIPPDSIARTNGASEDLQPEILAEIASVSPPLKLIAHGVGLSIGSFDKWNESYLRLLDQLFERFTLEWHSEHLAYTTVDGENLGTMLALPRTEETLDLICERVCRIQQRYKVPFLLEHVIQLLPDAQSDYSNASFLNAITARTGCGLIVDAYNLECDRFNQGLDIPSFLAELNLEHVRELHVAGGTQHFGFQLDIHSRLTAESTLALALDIIARSPNLNVVTFEFLKEAIPALGHEGICDELARIRKAIAQ